MINTRTSMVKRNVLYTVLQNFLNILIALLSRVIFVKVLDDSYLGINGLFANVLNILSLADLGIGTAMMYSLYKPIADNNKDEISALIAFFRKVYLGIAIIIFVLGMSLIPVLPYVINLQEPIEHLNVYYFLSLINVVISYVYVYRTTLVSADQKNYILNKYNMFFKIATLIFQTVVLFTTENYICYLLVAVIISFISNLYQNHITLKLYPFLKKKASLLDSEKKKKIIKDVKALFLYRFAGTIQSNTDTILVSIFVGTIYVGYYSNYSLIMTQVVALVTLIFNAVKASIGNLVASEERDINKQIFIFDVFELMNFWLIGFCTIAFVALFEDAIIFLFGNQYVLSLGIVICMVLNFYTSNIRQTIWIFRETTGLFQETKHITLVTAIINLILSVIMGYYYGMLGIIMATIIARMVYAWWKEPCILFEKIFNAEAKRYFVTYTLRFLLCVVVCCCTYVLCSFVAIENIFIRLVAKLIIVCIVSNVAFGLFFCKTKEFKYIVNKILPSNKY